MATSSPIAAWLEWAVGSALRGASRDALVAEMVDGGLDERVARGLATDVLDSPILAASRVLLARGAAMESAARLHRAVDPEPLVDCDAIDERTLYREHWTAHRPLVLRGAAASWPSSSWTWDTLRGDFAFAPVDVSIRGLRWWLEPRRSLRMPFGELVDHALGPASDAVYADGRSNVLDQAGMVPLRAHLGLLPGLVGDGHPRAWVGPAGTITPTHHDQSTAWQVLLLGRKRIHLASPLEPVLAGAAQGLFSAVDPSLAQEGERREVRWHVLELGPGDAAFVPVGWWHRVEALEPSFSVSFSGFRWPNAFAWYLPGRY